MQFTVFLILVALSAGGYWSGRARALRAAAGTASRFHSTPTYHGLYTALWVAGPAALLLGAWAVFGDALISRLVLSGVETARAPALVSADLHNLIAGVNADGHPAPVIAEAAVRYRMLDGIGNGVATVLTGGLALFGLWWAARRIGPNARARVVVERVTMALLVLCALVAIVTTIGIVMSLVVEAARFFRIVSPIEFLFGLHWSPQVAMRPDQIGSSGSFGAVPLFAGSALIAAVALVVAVPVGLMSAIYLAEYASPRARMALKPMVEILAGIPTVVYGFFAALSVAPFLSDLGSAMDIDVAMDSALAAGLVMGLMIIPSVSSLSHDVIMAVPRALRDGSWALGATPSETIRHVVLPAAMPGIVAAVVLAVSRAIGETMIVTMAAGLTANLTADPLASVTTVTTQIATLLVGDQEFDNPKTLAAFGLGLVLFVLTLALNGIALRVIGPKGKRHD